MKINSEYLFVGRGISRVTSMIVAIMLVSAILISFLPTNAYALDDSEDSKTEFTVTLKFADDFKDRVLKVGEKFKDSGAQILDQQGKVLYSFYYEDGKTVVKDGNGKTVSGIEDDIRVIGNVDTSREGDYVLTYKFGNFSIKKVIPVRNNVSDYKPSNSEAIKQEVQLIFTIKLSGEEKMVKICPEDFEDPGVNVIDKYGTTYKALSLLVKKTGKVDSNKVGQYQIKYTYGTINLSRTVYYVSKEQTAEITLLFKLVGSKDIYLKEGQTYKDYKDLGAVLTDEDGKILYRWVITQDGQVTVLDAKGAIVKGLDNEIRISGAIKLQSKEVVLIYKFGDASISRVIHPWTGTETEAQEAEEEVRELTFILAILEQQELQLSKGSEFVEPGFAVFARDGKCYQSLKNKVLQYGEVDTSQEGVYKLNYTLVSTVIRIVKVGGSNLSGTSSSGSINNPGDNNSGGNNSGGNNPSGNNPGGNNPGGNNPGDNNSGGNTPPDEPGGEDFVGPAPGNPSVDNPDENIPGENTPPTEPGGEDFVGPAPSTPDETPSSGTGEETTPSPVIPDEPSGEEFVGPQE